MKRYGLMLFVLLALAALSASVHAEQKIVEVPEIGNMSEANAYQKLEEIGLVPKFQECFSNATKKYYVVPRSQDPNPGTKLLLGRDVSAVVSQGPFPTVVGLSENEAKDLVDKANLENETIYDRNSTVKEGFVFYQEPKEASCPIYDLKVKIYVNRPLTIEIEKPKQNENVSSAVVVTGRLSSDLNENEYLWIAVKPVSDVKSVWPQNNIPRLVPVNREFEGNAFLGGNKGSRFEIGILVVDEDINKIFMEWLNTSLEEKKWPSITQGRAGTNQKVPKEVIDAHKLAQVNVILDQ
jgi:hypothetical protein